MNVDATLTAKKVSPTARLLVKILEAKARGYAECWCTTRTLVKALICCEKTFYNALKQLQEIGLIRVIRDYSRQSRRRIILLWKSPSDLLPEAPSVTASSSSESPVEIAVMNEPPLEPPNRSEEKEYDDLESAEPGVAPDASPVESSSSPSDEPRKATPAEVEAVVTKAKKLFPDAWLIGQQVKRQAKLCVPFGGGLSWVAMALNEAEAARAHSFGHVVRTLGIWREQGYPSPRQSKPVSSPSIAASLVEKQRQEHLAEIAEAAKPAPPPTAEEIATWLEWVAAGPRQPLYKFALGSLMKAGVPIPTGATQ